MRILAGCLFRGQGVTENPAQAVAWYQKAADLGDVSAKASLGVFLLHGDARAGVAQDAARGFALLQEAVDQGHGLSLQLLAQCYLRGEGVEKDAVRGVSLLGRAIATVDERRADAEMALAACYAEGNGVEADTVQAALWSLTAVTIGNELAIEFLAIIRECNFCHSTPARQLCVRCLKVRYCDRQCQLAHWNHATDAHKGPCKEHCRRAAEASQQEAGGASTSAQ